MKMMILNQMWAMGFAPIISEARSTVNGLVIAPANPNPHAIMQHRNPVNESNPTITHSAVMIGSMVSISSNSPRKDPKQ